MPSSFRKDCAYFCAFRFICGNETSHVTTPTIRRMSCASSLIASDGPTSRATPTAFSQFHLKSTPFSFQSDSLFHAVTFSALLETLPLQGFDHARPSFHLLFNGVYSTFWPLPLQREQIYKSNPKLRGVHSLQLCYRQCKKKSIQSSVVMTSNSYLQKDTLRRYL